MAIDQFYEESLQRKLEDIQARRLQLQGNLAISKRDGDHDDAADEIAQIAQLDDQAQSLVRLYQRTVAESTPPAELPQTSEEWRTKAAERMTPEDGLEVARRSKYGANLDWHDPGVRAGYLEMQRRRRANENQG